MRSFLDEAELEFGLIENPPELRHEHAQGQDIGCHGRNQRPSGSRYESRGPPGLRLGQSDGTLVHFDPTVWGVHRYEGVTGLLESLQDEVVALAEAKAKELEAH